MKLKHILFFMFATSSFAAFCQPANSFLGKWKVTWSSANGSPQVSNLNIDGSGGSWQTLIAKKRGPRTSSCDGLEVPISIESSSADAMTIKLKFSEALQGCADSTVELKRVDDKTITGRRGKADLVLSRE